MNIQLLNSILLATIDDEDFEKVSKYKWRYNSKNGYAYTTYNEYGGYKNYITKNIYLHHIIGGHIMLDHINRNKLDCRKENLREATQSTNGMNRDKYTGYTSIYKGVCKPRGRNKWMANIKINQKGVYLGTFKTEKDAAIAYNEAAKRLFGEFANLNEIC